MKEIWHGPGRIYVKSASVFSPTFLVSKILVVVLGPIGVEDAPSARFASYGIKINILTCHGFRFDGK